MSRPQSWMYDDINDQLAEQADDERGEHLAGAVLWHPADDPNYPDKRDLAEMAYWDRLEQRRERDR